MSDLINIGLSATRAVSASLRMVGENIANADDPAYVRRRLLLTEATMPTRGSPLYKTQVTTGGVEISGVGRSVDPLLDSALRRAEATRAETGQRADWLTRLETAVNDGEFGIGARMTDFFAAGTRAIANPSDAGLRLEMLSELQRVGEGFADTAARIDAIDADLTGTMTSNVETLNTRLAALAGINRDLRAARPGSAAQAQLFDRRDLAIRDIGTIVPANIATDRFGAATLTVGGVAIVAGITSETLTAVRDPGGGITLATSTATPVPLSGGVFDGMANAGTALRQRRSELDGLAANFVGDINSWNAAGAAPTGLNIPLMSGSSASTIAVATADPMAIAAATAGGNPAGNLLALSALRTDSGSEAQWKLYITSSALDLRNARADANAAAVMADRASEQRDSVSGVDLDLEAGEMLRLQQAYGAAARILQVARDTVQTILDIA